MNLEDIDRALGPVGDTVEPAEPFAPVEAVAAVAPVAPVAPAPGTSWRDALSAWGRPSGEHVSDEDIFAILNGGSDGVTPDELCATLGVTLPMYCVWKSKYRKLDLDQLRQARRGERRRRQTVVGLVALTAVLLTGGIGVTLVRAMSATFTDDAGSPAASRADRQPLPSSALGRPIPAKAAVREVRTADLRVVADAPPPPPPPPNGETGYQIQVTAADSEQQGRELVSRLTSQGYPAFMTQAVVGERNVLRVRVGPFDTRPAAQAVANQLKAAGYAGAWIARP